MQKFLNSPYFIPAHVIGFFIAQSIYAYSYAHTALANHQLLQSIIRPIIWLGPVLLVLAACRENVLDYLKLRGNWGKGLLWGAGAGILILLYNAGAFYIQHQHIGFTFTSLKGGLAAFFSLYGLLLMITEELLFRGFFLQKFAERLIFGSANLLQAALFMLLHLIGWTITRAPVSLVSGGLFVLVFALLEGYIFRKSNSIWACVLVHVCNNFMAANLI